MRNLVECNIVIPKIITIRDEEESDQAIKRLAAENGIDEIHILLVKPEKEELVIDQIRQMQKDLQVTFPSTLLIVLTGLDSSGVEVQNSLLKLLEEESERFLFILLVKNPSHLLPTIISRCTLVAPDLSGEEKTTMPKSEDYAVSFSFQSNSESTKESAVAKIDSFLKSHSLKNTLHLSHILTMRKLILDNNINPILALDSILLFLSKTGTMNVSNGKKK